MTDSIKRVCWKWCSTTENSKDLWPKNDSKSIQECLSAIVAFSYRPNKYIFLARIFGSLEDKRWWLFPKRREWKKKEPLFRRSRIHHHLNWLEKNWRRSLLLLLQLQEIYNLSFSNDGSPPSSSCFGKVWRRRRRVDGIYKNSKKKKREKRVPGSSVSFECIFVSSRR